MLLLLLLFAVSFAAQVGTGHALLPELLLVRNAVLLLAGQSMRLLLLLLQCQALHEVLRELDSLIDSRSIALSEPCEDQWHHRWWHTPVQTFP